jgi:DNA primase
MALSDVIIEEARKHLRFVKSSGPNNIGGPCPFHKGGMEKRPSFYINTQTGVWICHSCGRKGSFPQFLKELGASRAKVDLVMELAREEHVEKAPKAHDLHGHHFISEGLLGVLDFCPVSLVDDGFDPDLLQKLDVGFDKADMRVTYPIRDLYGNLVGISGRTVEHNVQPRYKVYKAADIIRVSGDDEDARAKYNGYDIKNHNYFWNMHNVWPGLFYGTTEALIIVEGYKACIWMLQCGVENVVALQGAIMSQVQEATLSKVDATIMLYLDNNKAGRRGTLDTGRRLIKQGKRVLVVTYPEQYEEGAQPDSLDKEETMASLSAAQHFTKWRATWNTHHNDD